VFHILHHDSIEFIYSISGKQYRYNGWVIAQHVCQEKGNPDQCLSALNPRTNLSPTKSNNRNYDVGGSRLRRDKTMIEFTIFILTYDSLTIAQAKYIAA